MNSIKQTSSKKYEYLPPYYGNESYHNNYQNNGYDTTDVTNHKQMLILDTEWDDLKKHASRIEIINPNKIYTFKGLVAGAAISNIFIVVFYFFYYIFTKDGSIELAIYSFLTILSLGILFIIPDDSKESDDKVSQSKVHLANLNDRINTIENRNKKNRTNQ